jgi:hypothetical protein
VLEQRHAQEQPACNKMRGRNQREAGPGAKVGGIGGIYTLEAIRMPRDARF